MISLLTLPLKSIDLTGVELPKRTDPNVATLVDSIREIGQLQPVLLTKGRRLIAGRHRYVAHQVLGLKEIDAKLADLDDLGLELATIDENLARRVLPAIERADQLARRKEIYEAMHPTAKAGGDRKSTKARRSQSDPGFAKDTADKTGTAERTVHQYVQASTKIDPAAKKLIAAMPAESAPGISELTKLARLDAEKQRAVARRVAETGESVKGAVKAIKKEEAVKNVKVWRPPLGKYAVIVADPSWPFEDDLDGSDEARGGVSYPPQTEEEICAMDVGERYAAPNCALWLWATGTHLMNGAVARVLDAWGFTGKIPWAWRKVDKKGNDRLGTGHYGQNVLEYVVLAIRGKPVICAEGVPNMFDAPRTSRHSEKPARFFEIAEQVTPCAPEARLELHAVDERKGWCTSGSEQQAKARAKHADAREPQLERAEPQAGADEVLRARGWESCINGFTKKLHGADWFIDFLSGGLFEAYRPQQGTIRTKNLGRFTSVELAADAVAAEAPPVGKKRKLQIQDVSA